MNVKELREALEGLPDTMEILLSETDEIYGTKLQTIKSNAILSDIGNIYYDDESAADTYMGTDEWEEMKESEPRCLVLYAFEPS